MKIILGLIIVLIAAQSISAKRRAAGASSGGRNRSKLFKNCLPSYFIDVAYPEL
jgi:hypothetical protein